MVSASACHAEDDSSILFIYSKFKIKMKFIKLEQETHSSRRVGVRNATATL